MLSDGFKAGLAVRKLGQKFIPMELSIFLVAFLSIGLIHDLCLPNASLAYPARGVGFIKLKGNWSKNMSYDLIVCARPIDESDSLSWKTENVEESSPREQEKLEKFLEHLLSKYPAVEKDGSASEFWSSAPKLEAKSATLVLNATYSKASSILPDIIGTGRDLQVSIFDYQTSRIYRPDGFKGITLEVENEASYIAPTKSQIREAVNSLTAKTGPSLLFMEEKGSEDYVQVAGGDGAFTLEWREYAGKNFKHYVAGLKTGKKNEEVTIYTNGSHLKVMGNERLGVLETEKIMKAFAENRIRPTEYEWRDITGKFTK